MSSADILIACMERSLPFVAYQLPQTNDIRLLIPEKIKSFLFQTDTDLLSQEAFCVVPFDNEHEPSFLLYPRFDESLATISSQNINWILQYPLQETSLSLGEQEKEGSYELSFREAQKMFADGVQKIVLSRRKLIKGISIKQVPEIFLRLCSWQNNTYNYLLSLPEVGVWLGASPELFLQNDGESLRTVSLAGTISSSDKTVWTEKEEVEQRLVTDYIEGLLTEFGVNTYTQEATISSVAGNVQHLKTNFSFSINELKFPLEKFIAALHPTPAVNGLPKEKTKKFILKQEKHKRELYAGFLGKIGINNQFDFYVNIRCMQFFANGVGLYAGGGLTAESDLDAEFAETELKAKGLINLF